MQWSQFTSGTDTLHISHPVNCCSSLNCRGKNGTPLGVLKTWFLLLVCIALPSLYRKPYTNLSILVQMTEDRAPRTPKALPAYLALTSALWHVVL